MNGGSFTIGKFIVFTFCLKYNQGRLRWAENVTSMEDSRTALKFQQVKL